MESSITIDGIVYKYNISKGWVKFSVRPMTECVEYFVNANLKEKAPLFYEWLDEHHPEGVL